MTASPSEKSLINELMAHLTLDWAYASWISGDAATLVKSLEDRRAVALGVLASAVLDDLAQLGTLANGHFEPFSGSRQASLVAAAEDWLSLPHMPALPGEVCWIDATEAGESLGNDIVAVQHSENRNDQDVYGEGQLRALRSKLRSADVELRELVEALDIDAVLADRTAIVLGVVIEAMVRGQIRLVRPGNDLGSDFETVYRALLDGYELQIESIERLGLVD